MRTEPSVIVGTLTAGVTAILALMTAFGLSLTPDQQTAILGVIAVVGPLVAGVLIRSRVYSPATVEDRGAHEA